MTDDAGRYDVSGNPEAQYVDTAQEVLKNKKEITDLRTLQMKEEDYLADAYDRLFKEIRSDTPIKSKLIRYVHEIIFSDLYDWAGKWRTVRISKPGVSWPPPDFLEQAMQDFEKNILTNYPASDLTNDELFSNAIAHIQGEFLAIHPFREGNARTIKLVTDFLAAQTKRPILRYDMTPKGRRQYIAAAKAALMKKNYQPLQKIILESLKRATKLPSIS